MTATVWFVRYMIFRPINTSLDQAA